MSRGPGKWQRVILDALERSEWVVVCDLLPGDARRAEISAINRAAHLLEGAGLVGICYRQRPAAQTQPGRWRPQNPAALVVHRLGVTPPFFRWGKWESAETVQAARAALAKRLGLRVDFDAHCSQSPHLQSELSVDGSDS